MKKILQAAALILLTASVVLAAAHSSRNEDTVCHHEWQKAGVDHESEYVIIGK